MNDTELDYWYIFYKTTCVLVGNDIFILKLCYYCLAFENILKNRVNKWSQNDHEFTLQIIHFVGIYGQCHILDKLIYYFHASNILIIASQTKFLRGDIILFFMYF